MNGDFSRIKLVRRSAGRPAKGNIEAMERALLETARSVFLQRGYAGTKLDEIASTAGVSKRTIYSRYASKAALFEATISDFIAQRLMPLEHGAGKGNSAYGRLVHLGKMLADITRDSATVAVHRAVSAEHARFPDLMTRLHELGHKRVTALVNAELVILRAHHPRTASELFYAMFVLAPLQAPEDIGTVGELDVTGMVDIVLHAARCGAAPSAATAPELPISSGENATCDIVASGVQPGVAPVLDVSTGAGPVPCSTVTTETQAGDVATHRRADAAGNRSRLLDAAEAIFLEAGVNASLDLIAERAGVGRATLFRNFADRRTLINSLLERGLRELEHDAVTLDPDALQLGRLLHLVATRMVERASLTESWLTSGYDDPALHAAIARFISVFEKPVAWAVAGGECRADLTASDILLLVSMFSGALYARGRQARMEQIERAWQMACQASGLQVSAFATPR